RLTLALPVQPSPCHLQCPSSPTRRSSDLHVQRAVGISALHRFDHDMQDVIVAAERLEVVAFEDVEHLDETQSARRGRRHRDDVVDRKSTRLNSSHVKISYARFRLKKKIDT